MLASSSLSDSSNSPVLSKRLSMSFDFMSRCMSAFSAVVFSGCGIAGTGQMVIDFVFTAADNLLGKRNDSSWVVDWKI